MSTRGGASHRLISRYGSRRAKGRRGLPRRGTAQNRRGRPLVSREAVVELIGNTTTKTGLTVLSELDGKEYPTGMKVTDGQMGRAVADEGRVPRR